MTDILLEVALDLGHQRDPEDDRDQCGKSRKDEHQGSEDHDTKGELVSEPQAGKNLGEIIEMVKVEASGSHEGDQSHDVNDLSWGLNDQMFPTYDCKTRVIQGLSVFVVVPFERATSEDKVKWRREGEVTFQLEKDKETQLVVQFVRVADLFDKAKVIELL